MLFIGDCHGCFGRYIGILKNHSGSTLQVGDMGVGFGHAKPLTKDYMGVASEWIPEVPFNQLVNPRNHKWIRGNHDNPAECLKYPTFIGDYGYDAHTGIFWFGGGYSPDWKYRVPTLSWWEDEEQSFDAIGQAITLYKKVKPAIMVSHEAPSVAKVFVLQPNGFPNTMSRTEMALQHIMDIHEPSEWIFGHYHIRKTFKHGPTRFHCLGELKNDVTDRC